MNSFTYPFLSCQAYLSGAATQAGTPQNKDA